VTAAPEDSEAVPRPGAVFHIVRNVLRPVLWIVYGWRRQGHRNLPAQGPVLLAANHLSGWDTVLIPLASPRPVQFLTKSAYFTKPGLKGRFMRWFFTSIGGVPVHRSVGHDAQAALHSGSAILRSGAVFAVFPEGTRSRDGRLYKGRSGAAWMALDTGAMVVPVGVLGTHAMRPFAWGFGRSRPEIRFGEPINLDAVAHLSAGAARRQVTDQIMNAIAALTGQERVDMLNAGSRDE